MKNLRIQFSTAWLVLAAIVTGAGARIGALSLESAIDGMPLIHLPVAVLVSLLFMAPRTMSWDRSLILAAYAIGGVLAFLKIGFDAAPWLILEILEVLLIQKLCQKYCDEGVSQNVPATLVYFSIATVFACCIFAVVGFGVTITVFGADLITASRNSIGWAMSHMAAFLTITPFVLMWISPQRRALLRETRHQPILFLTFLMTGVVVVLISVAGQPLLFADQMNLPVSLWLLFLMAPGAVFAAYRIGIFSNLLIMMTCSLLAMALASSRVGAFSAMDPNLLRLMLTMGTLSNLLIMGYVKMLLHALAEAENASSDRNRFLASIGHELRSSLTGVIGAAELLQKEMPEDADPQGRLGLIQRTGVLMSRLVEDAVEYSQLDDEGFELSPVDFSLADATRDSAELFRQRLNDKGVKLILDVGDLDEIPLHADSARIRQVLINLISNASKFTSSGEVKLTLRARPKGDVWVACEVEVADTGPGVPDNKKRDIFQAFSRSSADAGGGLGLGLAISRDIAHAMQGSLSVFDRENGGAIFRFKFVAERARSPETVLGQETMPAGNVPYPARSVLVADDNNASRIILEAMLKAAGHRVTGVENGLEAVNKMKTESFDLVLLDMHMPLMSGPVAINEIRRMENGRVGTPILVVSGNEGDQVREQLRQLGAVGLVTKPFSAENLLQAVNAALATQ